MKNNEIEIFKQNKEFLLEELYPKHDSEMEELLVSIGIPYEKIKPVIELALNDFLTSTLEILESDLQN